MFDFRVFWLLRINPIQLTFRVDILVKFSINADGSPLSTRERVFYDILSIQSKAIVFNMGVYLCFKYENKLWTKSMLFDIGKTLSERFQLMKQLERT